MPAIERARTQIVSINFIVFIDLFFGGDKGPFSQNEKDPLNDF
jgi:hypothetical protein